MNIKKLSVDQKKSLLLQLAKKEKFPQNIKGVAYALISSKLILGFSGESLYSFFHTKKTFLGIIDMIEYKNSSYDHLKPFDWLKLQQYLKS